MRRTPALFAAAVLACSTNAFAQDGGAIAEEANPDAEFQPFQPSAPPLPAPAPAPETAPAAPGSDTDWTAPPPPGDAAITPPPVVPPPPRAPLGEVSPAPQVVVQRPPPAEFNHVSIYGAPTLGQWKRGFGAYMGFPLLGIKAGIGVLDRLDVGVGFDTFWGVMNEPRVSAKLNLFQDPHWALSVQVEGGAAFFTQRPEAEGKGARWLTGRRNFNVEPGLIVSYRGDTAQSARMFLDVRYHAAFDTQPYAKDPLGGVPPSVVLGHNVPVRMGAEMPFTPKTSFLFIFGFDIHGRTDTDSTFMPVVSVGLVSGF